MLELDCAARGAGICAVVGMGASPGMSNLLGRDGSLAIGRGRRSVYSLAG